jgi:hypothetical protein
MHDPMVVAWEVPLFIPKRERWRDKHYNGRRWGFSRKRFTNPEHLGKPIYRWWRPAGWTFALAGRVIGWRRLATIWHVEPGGHDSGEVCRHLHRWQDDDDKWHSKPLRAWRWHVWHWHIQIPFLQGTRARLFDRCALCGRKGRPNISHQWDGKHVGWRKWRSREGLYHRECSELLSRRRTIETDETLIRHLFAGLELTFDVSEAEMLARLTDPKSRGLEFHEAYRLTKLLGYERDESYRLVKKP